MAITIFIIISLLLIPFCWVMVMTMITESFSKTWIVIKITWRMHRDKQYANHVKEIIIKRLIKKGEVPNDEPVELDTIDLFSLSALLNLHINGGFEEYYHYQYSTINLLLDYYIKAK